MGKKPAYEELEHRVRELEKEAAANKRTEEDLRERESKFRLLYERAPLGYQSLDENGYFVDVNEAWLETLGRSDIPTTLFWGELDEIAPLEVPDHVWTKYLEGRETPAAYWRSPCADQYLQVDTPELIVDIIRTTLAEDEVPPEIDGTLCQVVRIH